MGPHAVPLATRHAVWVMAVIAAADVNSFIVHRPVAESDSIAVAIAAAVVGSFIVHRSVAQPVSIAVLITESDA